MWRWHRPPNLRLTPRTDEGLGLDAEGIGNAVDVVAATRDDDYHPPGDNQAMHLRLNMHLPASSRSVRPAAAILAFALALLPGPLGGPPSARADEDALMTRLRSMSPEERVGQLFIVAYFATGDDPLADISTMIREDHIGGVVLQKGNNIFANVRGGDLPGEIAGLTAALQAHALGEGGGGIPLFIAVDHEGNGDPLTHLREGFTAIPSQMALGATWDPASAEAVGRIVGEELAAVGVNLLLGPVLDVLAEPRVDTGGDIGTRAFGGHPYWVTRMGLAYIRGVHAGSEGHVATVAKHFPGHGGSDRLPDDEVATVHKSLTELRRIELPPFAAVTDPAAATGEGAPAITDALMTSHIRYRGFQGNLQDATAPISFDPEGMRQLLALEGYHFGEWRRAGGLIVADSLGVRAVKRMFDKDLQTFPNREIARQALMAGNDVLILAQFSQGGGWAKQMATIQDTVHDFADRYRKDSTFRARVDDAALRVLRRKATLHPDWTIEAVAAQPERARQRVGRAESRDSVAQIAGRAVTVLRRGGYPSPGERLVVVTEDGRRPETHPQQRPLACPDELCGLDPARWERLTALGPTLVEATMLDGYGPDGKKSKRIVAPDRLTSLSFCQLDAVLSPVPEAATPAPGDPGTAGFQPASPNAPPTIESAGAPGPNAVQPIRTPAAGGTDCLPADQRAAAIESLAGADWIVFAISDLKPDDVSRLNGFFLAQVGKLSSARLAALSFGPPYYIQATNVARLDTYIAAYSRIPASIEAAVDALLDVQWTPKGRPNPPVTVEDAGYNLTTALEPDPEVPLVLSKASPSVAASSDSDRSTDPDTAVLPARVAVQVEPIRDHNGNTVPDGTLVRFTSDPPAALAGGPAVAETRDGAARAELTFPLGGRVKISAETTTGGAASADPLVVDLPLPSPTPEPPPLPLTPSPGGGDDAGGGRADGTSDGVGDSSTGDDLGGSDLLLSLAALFAVGAVGAVGANGRGSRARDLAGQLRLALFVAAGGLSGYLIYGLALDLGSPRPGWLTPGLAAAATTLGGALVGLAIGRLATRRLSAGSAPTPRETG
jgi:beta-N-acetylhexosaminidase